MMFGSVCSGIEAASVAWGQIGWSAQWFSEIEPFPSAVIDHHYPGVPNLGDMTKLAGRIRSGEVPAPDVFCGGTPCQAFSVAGARMSLDDDRGNLTLIFCEIANAIDNIRSARGQRASIILWENVPGVLNTKDNAFGHFLAGLAGEDDPLVPAGKRWTNAGCVFGTQRTVAWRTLDAQYFGLAQRRRRVFVVASARDDFDPAAVLFEFDGVRRDTAPSREAGKVASRGVAQGLGIGGGAGGQHDGVARFSYAIQGSMIGRNDNAGPNGDGFNKEVSFTQNTTDRHAVAVALRGRDGGSTAEMGDDLQNCLRASGGGGDKPHVLTAMQVRRLTPVECERLMGFPDNYTLIPWRGKPAELCPDGPRYKALGNSWAVPVVRWIGARIHALAAESHGNDNKQIFLAIKVNECIK